MNDPLNDAQPPPVPNDAPAVWALVVADMRERDAVGAERYGTRLQPFNGRDALVDAYQEALDLTVYLRQAIAERDDPADTVWRAMARARDAGAKRVRMELDAVLDRLSYTAERNGYPEGRIAILREGRNWRVAWARPETAAASAVQALFNADPAFPDGAP